MTKFLILLTLSFALCVCATFSQNSKAIEVSPQITGEILRLIREDKKDWIVYETTVKFTLQNPSKRKLFLLKDGLRIEGLEIFKNMENASREVFLRYDTPPSFSGNTKWIVKGEELWKSNTKSELLIFIDSEKSFSFERKYTFGFPRENRNYGKGYLWTDIKNEKSLFMKMKLSLWENELRTRQFSSEIFPKKLSGKINKQGILIFDDIISEPIPLDLSSATVKTESQP